MLIPCQDKRKMKTSKGELRPVQSMYTISPNQKIAAASLVDIGCSACEIDLDIDDLSAISTADLPLESLISSQHGLSFEPPAIRQSDVPPQS